jgi:3-O-methylgallate 3,4-dioxygenase
MAEVVLAIATSHSPALLMGPDAWLARGKSDDVNVHALYDFNGKRVEYDELLATASPDMAGEIAPEVLQERHERNQAGVAETKRRLQEAKPDLVIMIADDHWEVFKDDNMPLISVHWGETLPYIPQGMMKWKYDDSLRLDNWYPQESMDYPVNAAKAKQLIGDLIAQNFDVSHTKHYKEGQGMTHAFAYVYKRVMDDVVYPVIPVSINTYFPPNQIPARRAFELGAAIRKAVEAWEEPLRVVIMATGGLSHFVVDEKFDREFLDLMERDDVEEHAALPEAKLQAGNSEFRCWSALAGAVSGMKMDLIDYIPCYRSLAGTGCGMAFATWQKK